MNLWKERNVWQKWGIVFGIVHIILFSSIFLLFIYNTTVGGSGETGLLVLLINYPLYLLINYAFPHFVESKLLVPSFFLLGTLFWAFTGVVLGLIFQKLTLR